MLFFEHVKLQPLDTCFLTNYCTNVFCNLFPMRDLGRGENATCHICLGYRESWAKKNEEKVRVMNKNYWDEHREEKREYNKEYSQREVDCEVCECRVRKCNWAKHLSSVIYFRHNDMQDCVIKLGKWYRTAVAEARGRLFVLFFCASSRKQMLCNRFLHIIHSLDISFSYLKILAIRSWPSRKYRNCMLKETSISL